MSRASTSNAQTQLNAINTSANQAGANAQSLFGPLTTQANSLINSGGYDPATLSAITNAGMGGVNAAFGSAEGDIKRTAARTNNQAGIPGELDALALNKGVAGGKEAGNIQEDNANFQNQQRMAGINLLGSLYGQNAGLNAQLLGEGTGAINAQTQASPGWVQSLGSTLSGIGGLIHGGKG